MNEPSAEPFDVVVIGGGPAGEVMAEEAVKQGLTAALVERELFGGECSYWACMPSKVMLRPVELRHELAGLPGLAAGAIDADAVLARRDRLAPLMDGGQETWADEVGVTLVRGVGALADERTVTVEGADGGRRLVARQAIVLATGSDPDLPPIAGLAEARPWTNREATRLTAVPRRLLVIGGGPVAVEMAQAIKGLGAEEVTIVADGERLLARMEPFAGEMVQAGLEKDGVTVMLDAKLLSVTRSSDGSVTARSEGGDVIEADEVLVAAGRHPRTAGLGLDRVGLDERQPLTVDDTMRVRDGLYAVGDVDGLAPLTHMGKYQARIAAKAIAARARGEEPGPRGHARAATAQVVFTVPQAAAVGMTLAEAKEAGLDGDLIRVDLASVSGASIAADDYAGQAAVVLDRSRDVIVGCTLVGPNVGEMLHAATIAVAGEVTLDTLWHAVPSFPTVSDFWLKLVQAAEKPA